MTQYDDGTTLLNDMVAYADHHPEFNREFVDIVEEFYRDYDFITSEQLKELTLLHKKNNVNDFIETLQ